MWDHRQSMIKESTAQAKLVQFPERKKNNPQRIAVLSLYYTIVYVRIIINEGEKNAKFELPFYKEVFFYFDP